MEHDWGEGAFLSHGPEDLSEKGLEICGLKEVGE